MDPDRWARVAELAEQAVQLETAERDRFVRERADGDAELEALIARTVALYDRADDFARDLAVDIALVLRDGAAPPVGSRLGAYRLDRLLGQGGMGLVYLAHRADDQFHKTVAVKVLPDTVGSLADREQFHVERQVLARLEHPAIARLLDGGVSDDGHPWYVLEYVEGVPVDQYVRTATREQTLRLFAGLCDAVAHAHARLVVHCDLKPANVMVTPDGRPKLLDFGIARSPGAARRGPVSRPWAAPELLTGEPVDARTDVYSLGVLLRALLAACGEPRDVSGITRAELDAIVTRATASRPDERYGGVALLREDVLAVLDARPLASPPPGVVAYRARKAVRRRPWVAGLAAGLAVAAVLAVLALGVSLRNSRQRRGRIAMQRDVAEALLDCVASPWATAGAVTAAEALAACEVQGRSVGHRRPGIEYLARLALLAQQLGQADVAERALAQLERGPPAARRRAGILRLASRVRGGDPAALTELETETTRCETLRDMECTRQGLRALQQIHQAAGDLDAVEAITKRAHATLDW